jgi:hypothetical protein
MPTFDTDNAFTLANKYNLSPPRCIRGGRKRTLNNGKFEPDRNTNPLNRCMILAHWQDKTNVIVQYNSFQLDQSP